MSAIHASDFVTIQIMELSANDSFEITSSPKSLFTYEMLDQASTAPSLLEANIPTLNDSPREADVVNNDIVPFHIDRVAYTHIEENSNVQNETDVDGNGITETNAEENIAQDRYGSYETGTCVDDTDNSNTRSRKRKWNMDQWKRNVTNRLGQSGQEYKDRKGNLKRARELNVTGDCGGTCRYRCSQKNEHCREERNV